MTPVGATNVGSITLQTEPVRIFFLFFLIFLPFRASNYFLQNFQSNVKEHDPQKKEVFTKSYLDEEHEKGHLIKRGDEVGFFKMGSTVVLIFESPELIFDVKAGDKVKMGSSLAHFVRKE